MALCVSLQTLLSKNMKRTNKIDEIIKKNPIVAIGLTVLVLGLVILVGFLVKKQFSPVKERKELVRVEFGDGNNSVVVERNGKVTINTPYGTFVQNWDAEKIRRFFEGLEDLDFDSLSSYIGGDLVMALTIGGEIIEISIDDPVIEIEIDELQEILEEIYEEEDLGNYDNYYDGGEGQDGYLGNVDPDDEDEEEGVDQDNDNP
jgi:hypothetical protein